LSIASTAIVAAVLGIAVIVVWVTLTRAAINDARVGLNRSVRQLAIVTVNGLRTTQVRFVRVAEDTAILRALRSPAPRNLDAARAALRRLGVRPDSGLPIELWNESGRRLGSVGTDSGETLGLNIPAEASEPESIAGRGLDSLRIVDSVQIGELQRVDRRTLFWLVMPVRDSGKLLGFVASRRHIASNPQTEATIRELSGNSATGYWRNADGSTWTSFGGFPETPPDSTLSSEGGKGERIRSASGRVLFAEGRVAGTPLVLGMEAPRSAILVVANAAARQLAVLGVLLTLVGALVTWVVGRRVTRPLTELTSAADAVARGDYSTRVPTAGTEEVVRLASSFNRMAQRIGDDRKLLETANRAKSDFLASMSHELRTPLNAIGGYTELMEMGVRGPITDEQRRDLARIRTSQSHLLGLIGSLLDMSRIESGQITYTQENVALDPLLGGLEALVLPQTTAKKQTLVYRCEEDLGVFADREKVRQVLLNLLSNAVRYSPSGATITMTARKLDEVSVAIEVSDTGPGIPLDRQRAVFEPFVQLDRSLTRTNEGVGLGLSISRDLAHGMHGELTVTSAPGEGSCFRLTLPAGVVNASTPTMQTGAYGVPAVAADLNGR
jgi:signal transduction histidine kinase